MKSLFARSISEPEVQLSNSRRSLPPQETDKIRAAIEVCERAASGDFEARINGIDQNTDFGSLCTAINRVLDISDAFVREAAAAMDACSSDRFHRPFLLRGLNGAFRKSATVINQAGAKMQQSNARLAATARLAVETASNVSMVATACEELNSSNGEIARQAAASAKQTESAVQQSIQAASAVKELNEAMLNIETIVTLINKIAGQTNLLALNATIEAARAGEHGRGFSVVANEVKELARGSAKATGAIAKQIETMQATVKDVVRLIENVNSAIQSIDQGASNIACAVKEQVQATDEISRNITEVSHKTNEISANFKSSSDRSV